MAVEPIPYETPFREQEVLLVFFQEEPTFYIRIENILADKKRGWWHVQFITLTLPTNEMSWILSDDHLRGGEFTMQNNPVRLERVIGTQTTTTPSSEEIADKTISPPQKSANIISMFEDDD